MGDININMTANVYNNNMGGNTSTHLGEDDNLIPTNAYIVNAENGLYLTDTNGFVTQELLDLNNERQIWNFERTESGSFFVLNKVTENAIGLEMESSADGIPIVTQNNTGSTFYQWRLVPNFVRIPGIQIGLQFINVATEKAITDPSGSDTAGINMQQFTRVFIRPENQLFNIEDADS